MSQINCDYSVRFCLPASPESPSSIGAKFVETLDTLSRIDPTVFADWEVMDFPARTSLPLAKVRSRIGAIVERNVARDDLGDPCPYYGYSANAFTKPIIESRGVALRIKAGGNTKFENSLAFGQWNIFPDPEIVTYPLFMAALLAINAVWLVPWACAQAFRANYIRVPLDDVPSGRGFKLINTPMIPADPTFPETIFHIPWIGYLSAERAAGVSPPRDLLTERTPDGGLLMTATTDRLDPDNPEHVRRSRILAEIMIAQTKDIVGNT